METNAISREEHDEFVKRIDEENARQDKRISLLEGSVKEIHALTSSVERLAANMEHMAKEQEAQGERLKTLEGRDGEMWRKVSGYIATALAGGAVGFLFTQLGF